MNPFNCGTAALALLQANGLKKCDKPVFIRSALESSLVDLYWEAMKAHFDCEDRHDALNKILVLNHEMDLTVERIQSMPDALWCSNS